MREPIRNSLLGKARTRQKIDEYWFFLGGGCEFLQFVGRNPHPPRAFGIAIAVLLLQFPVCLE